MDRLFAQLEQIGSALSFEEDFSLRNEERPGVAKMTKLLGRGLFKENQGQNAFNDDRRPALN